jgi:hypothetical protein
MSILNQIASSLGRRDEKPNQELAQQIVAANDTAAIKELVESLGNKNKDIRSDCIKVLYEIGERKPELIAGYAKNFIALLDSKNNRLQWGAMTALSSIAGENPKTIYAALSKIVAVSDGGTVITKDHCVKILIKLCAVKQYAEDSFALLLEQILNSPPNQMPTYAEGAIPFVNDKNKSTFVNILTSRLADVESDTKRKRIEKVLAKVSGKK